MDNVSHAESMPVVGWLSLAILDLGAIVLLRYSLTGVSIRSVLREKDDGSQPPGTQPVVTAGAAASIDPALDNTSYSRLAGFIGAIVMACFLWALGDFLIFACFTRSPEIISSILNSFGYYFLAGASLFTPYAFNQLSKVFKPG
jgi:hypothetical protein